MIIFKKIRYKNFLSTGNRFIEVQLNKHKTTYLTGKNGHGKSTVIDALTFALFGKAFRDTNKPDLVNNINGKDCLVELEFEIGTNKYLVRRGIKPNVFDIIVNGTQINRDADAMDFQKYLENTILKLNYKSFTQLVILGSASFVPFMQLPAGDRRVIIEDILDITIFSSMNSLLKENISIVKDEIKKYETQIDVIRGKSELQEEHINKLKEKQQAGIEDRQNKIAEARAKIKTHSDNIKDFTFQIDDITSSISDETQVVADIKKLDGNLEKVKDFISREGKELKFFQKNDSCHVCSQSILEDFKNNKIKEKGESIDTAQKKLADIESTLQKALDRQAEIVATHRKVASLYKQITNEDSEINALKLLIVTLDVQDSDVDDIQSEQQKLDEYVEEYKAIVEKKSEQEKELFIHEAAQSMLKDTGVKSKIIKQYLPVINKLINKYLSDLNFYAQFTLNENFKEEIKMRNRSVASYGSFSEGQKMRIDLALLFTWREIAKMKNSVNTNLLFLDEIFDSSLDAEGTEEFLKLLKSTDQTHNVFLISHKTDQLLDKFSCTLRFEMKGNFTTMKQI